MRMANFTLLLKHNHMLPKITTAIAVFGFLSLQSQAQLNVQSGATFYMQPGSQVTVQGNVDNAGTLNNDGTLRVQGNYTNTGTYTAVGTAGTLEMYGTGNATITPGSSSIANLTINKSAASDVVTLTASTTVNNSFTLTQGVLTTNPTGTPAVALISPATAPYTFAAGKEIIGRVTRNGWTNGTARVFNQPNMLVTTNAGTAPNSFTVIMIPNGDPTQVEREVKRKFNFAPTGGTGYTADIRYPYATSELNTNTEPGLAPWTLAGAEWNARTNAITRNAANDWVNITAIPAAELAQEWKLADQNYTMNVTALLRGPWTSGPNMAIGPTASMPLTQPYNTTPFNYAGTETVASIPANVVDWVLIEHRKPASGLPADALTATITGRQAGFLLTNGTVVGLDGVTAITVPIAKQGNAFLTIRHRNHLGLISNSLNSNATGSFTNDFTILANSYKPGSVNPVVLLPNSSKYGLWSGDANKNGAVTGTDVNLVKADIANNASGYRFQDITNNGVVSSADLNQAKATISSTGSGSGTEGRAIILQTNIPEGVIVE